MAEETVVAFHCIALHAAICAQDIAGNAFAAILLVSLQALHPERGIVQWCNVATTHPVSDAEEGGFLKVQAGPSNLTQTEQSAVVLSGVAIFSQVAKRRLLIWGNVRV